jgi:MerR family mercuric resistance operon transcriptional regulator
MTAKSPTAMQEELTIGRLARLAGVGVETIRYYQREGLIQQPPKPSSGYRRYPAVTLERLRFIQRAKALGFSLAEIAELLELGDGRCDHIQALAQHKLELVRAKQRDLAAMAQALEAAIAACAHNPVDAACPLVQSLAGREDTADTEGAS